MITDKQILITQHQCKWHLLKSYIVDNQSRVFETEKHDSYTDCMNAIQEFFKKTD